MCQTCIIRCYSEIVIAVMCSPKQFVTVYWSGIQECVGMRYWHVSLLLGHKAWGSEPKHAPEPTEASINTEKCKPATLKIQTDMRRGNGTRGQLTREEVQ